MYMFIQNNLREKHYKISQEERHTRNQLYNGATESIIKQFALFVLSILQKHDCYQLICAATGQEKIWGGKVLMCVCWVGR